MPEAVTPPNSPTTFYEWLGLQRHRVDSIGRLAVEAHRDKTFPRNHVQKLHVFLHYYEDNSDLRQAVKSAHAEWREFQRSRRVREVPRKPFRRDGHIAAGVVNGPDELSNTDNHRQLQITKIDEQADAM